MAVERRHYQFGPLEQRGVIIGLRGGQVGILATAAVIAVGLFRTGGGPGLLLALAVCSVGTAAAFVPVRGATLEQWTPTLLQWGSGAGRRRWLIDRPGPRPRPGPARRVARARTAPPPRVPRTLDGLAILEVVAAGQDEPIGILRDRRAGTFSVVLDVRGGAFALLDVADKERRLATWATVLASLGRTGSAIARIQWIERTFPAGSNRLPLPPATLTAGCPPPACRESYSELLDEAGPATQEHETLLIVTMRARDVSRAARARRAEGGLEGAIAAVAAREVRLLQGHLRTADLTVERVLGAAAYAQALRRSFAEQPQSDPSHARRGGASWPWPVATEATWASYRTDGTWHATYWVADWPRAEVGPDFLAPLILQSSGRRTVSLTMAPTNPLEAARSVEAAKTADAADSELRRRAGFLNSARRQRESQHLLRRETELAEGHADYRFSGFVTVTAPDPDGLQQSCAEVEQLAHQAHLELRRLYGRQDAAFTWTLPLGRGLG